MRVLLVASLVFRAPSGPAAREARRPHFVRRRASKPARALRSLRHPPHRRRCVADVCLCVGSLSGQAPPLPINFARNSPAACSIIEFASLELQCFWGVSKNDHDKLRAKFGRRRRLVADVLLGALLRSQAGSRASKRSLSSVSHAIP